MIEITTPARPEALGFPSGTSPVPEANPPATSPSSDGDSETDPSTEAPPDTLRQVQESTAAWAETCADWIRERPLTAVFAAFGSGVILGRVRR